MIDIITLMEKWAKEKGFHAHAPPPSRAFVNISLKESSAEYVTAWPEHGKVKFITAHPAPKGKIGVSIEQEVLNPGDPEFFNKIEKILLCLTPKK